MNAVRTCGIEADCAQAGQLFGEAFERRVPRCPRRAHASMLIAVSGLGASNASSASDCAWVRPPVSWLATCRSRGWRQPGARRDIDAVLVTELSRWGRSTTDLLATLKELEARRISLVALNGMAFDLSIYPRHTGA
jgi:hypothetical protein